MLFKFLFYLNMTSNSALLNTLNNKDLPNNDENGYNLLNNNSADDSNQFNNLRNEEKFYSNYIVKINSKISGTNSLSIQSMSDFFNEIKSKLGEKNKK